MSECKYVAIIPARYASSRLPGKPLKLIADKPMIQQVYERVCASQLLDDIYIATDDNRIVEACKKFNAKAVLTPVKILSGTDRVAWVAKKLALTDDTIIINVQCDQPLIKTQTIDDLIKPFKKERILEDMVTVVTPLREHEIDDPVHVKAVFNQNHEALYFSRAPIPYGRDERAHSMYKHLGIYAYSFYFLKKFIEWQESPLEKIEKLEQLRVLDYGHRIRIIYSPFDSPEVDIPEDVKRIEELMSHSN